MARLILVCALVTAAGAAYATGSGFWGDQGPGPITIKPPHGGHAPQVPEIDALAGTAALATIGASLALIWERRRRK